LFRREKAMGIISNDNKRILKNKLETAKEWLEGAIDEVDAIEKWDSSRKNKGAQYVVMEDWEQC